jgi:integrase
MARQSAKPQKSHRGHGEGSFRQTKNGTWRAWVTLPSGKRVSKTHPTKSAARSWVQEIQSGLEDSYSITQTLKHYILEWFETHATQIKGSTCDDYQKLIEKYIVPHLGGVLLEDLRRSTFDRFYLELQQSGVGSAQIRYIHRVLHKALQDAVQDRILQYNPSDRAKTPRKAKSARKPAPLSEAQTIHLVTTAMQTPIGPMIYLAIKTGMRQGELFALMWDDIDWDNRQIHVQRNLQRAVKDGKQVREFSTPKTATSCRTITVGEKTIDVLKTHHQDVVLKKALAGEKWKEMDLVFPSSVGTPMNPSNVTKQFRAVLEKANLKRIRFHDMRHIAASIMLNHGIPVMTVSNILGHSQPSTTLNMYGHHFSAINVQAAVMMDDIFEMAQPCPLPVEFQNLVSRKNANLKES